LHALFPREQSLHPTRRTLWLTGEPSFVGLQLPTRLRPHVASRTCARRPPSDDGMRAECSLALQGDTNVGKSITFSGCRSARSDGRNNRRIGVTHKSWRKLCRGWLSKPRRTGARWRTRRRFWRRRIVRWRIFWRAYRRPFSIPWAGASAFELQPRTSIPSRTWSSSPSLLYRRLPVLRL
jgi:hypothetical protein